MSFLFPTPQVFELPLTESRDLHFDFIYKPVVVDVDGDPILLNGKKQYVVADYPGGATVTLEIETDPVTTASGVISTHHAVFTVDYLVADDIKNNKKWRIKMLNGSVNDVLAHGRTKRADP